MTRQQIKITVPDVLTRSNWTSLEDTGFSSDVVFEIVQRYCDTQDHAKAYRTRAASKAKLIKQAVNDLAKASGVTVEEYLEIEKANLEQD